MSQGTAPGAVPFIADSGKQAMGVYRPDGVCIWPGD
jgi:hypothetical protein